MEKSWGAEILSFEDFTKIRGSLGRVVAVSGGFDPIHPGHISYINESRKFGDTLVVIVNGDAFLRTKKGKPFETLEERCLIVSGIVGVDYVVPFEINNDQTVIKALERLKPDVFTNGGDRRDKETIPEWETCQRLGIKMEFAVGVDKKWSSSQFLSRWDDSEN